MVNASNTLDSFYNSTFTDENTGNEPPDLANLDPRTLLFPNASTQDVFNLLAVVSTSDPDSALSSSIQEVFSSTHLPSDGDTATEPPDLAHLDLSTLPFSNASDQDVSELLTTVGCTSAPAFSGRNPLRVSTHDTPRPPQTHAAAPTHTLPTPSEAADSVLSREELQQLIFKVIINHRPFEEALTHLSRTTGKDYTNQRAFCKKIYENHRKQYKDAPIDLNLIPRDLLPPSWTEDELKLLVDKVNALPRNRTGKIEKGAKGPVSQELSERLAKFPAEIQNVALYLRCQSF